MIPKIYVMQGYFHLSYDIEEIFSSCKAGRSSPFFVRRSQELTQCLLLCIVLLKKKLKVQYSLSGSYAATTLLAEYAL